MSKIQQQWIAVLVILTFIGLLRVSSLPINAENSPNEAGMAAGNTEEKTGFTEVEGEAVPQAKKKSILPKILIGVGVVAVAAVLYFVVFKKKAEEYDITGEWKFSWRFSDETIGNYKDIKFVCIGDKKQGTYKYYWVSELAGSYTVDGKNVSFTVDYSATSHYVHTGTFETKDKITGTFQKTGTNFNGTWELVRKISN